MFVGGGVCLYIYKCRYEHIQKSENIVVLASMIMEQLSQNEYFCMQLPVQ